MAIKDLTRLSALTGNEVIPCYSPEAADERGFVASLLTQSDLAAMTTQFAVVTATGFNALVRGDGTSTWLILQPSAAYAAGTITLPSSLNAEDNQEILVNSTQAVTALTVAGNGASVVGAPTTLAQNGFFRLRFSLQNSAWYRVG